MIDRLQLLSGTNNLGFGPVTQITAGQLVFSASVDAPGEVFAEVEFYGAGTAAFTAPTLLATLKLRGNNQTEKETAKIETALEYVAAKVISRTGVVSAAVEVDVISKSKAFIENDVLEGSLITDWQSGPAIVKVSTNAGETVALDPSMPVFGGASLKCTLGSIANGVFIAEKTLPTPITQAYFNSIEIPLFCPFSYGAEIGAGAVVQLWLYTESGKQLRPQATITGLLPNGWLSLHFGRDGIYSGTDTPSTTDGEKITKIRVVVTAVGVGGSFWLGPITMNKRRKKGSILIYADGQYAEQRDYLLPLLDKYGLKANLALTWKDIGGSGRMSYAQLQAAYETGHCIINHTYGPASTGWDNVTDWPDAASIVNSQQSAWAEMASRGWTRGIGHQVVGYTSGWDYGDAAAIKQKIYDGLIAGGTKSLRQGGKFLGAPGGVGALYGPQPETLPFSMIHGGIQVTSTDVAQNIKDVVDAAERRGHCATILFHRIVANTATPGSLEMKVSEAAAALEHVADRVRLGGVLNPTVDQL